MAYITVGQENKYVIQLHYTDRGAGEPIVLIHGYPFSGSAWERQEAALLEAGFRVITYDRRGFGESSKPSIGYDYDTFAADLKTVIEALELQHVTLVGHSMGTGEIARYLGKYGSQNIARAVMISPIPPFLLKTAENPTGVDQKVFEGIKSAIKKDRYAYMTEFLKSFYNLGAFSSEASVSPEKQHADFNLGAKASGLAFLKCVDSWLEDFRSDVGAIDVPLLIIQGDADKILPLKATGEVLAKTIGTLITVSGGSHGIPWTHHEEINEAIINFMAKGKRAAPSASVQNGIQPNFQ